MRRPAPAAASNLVASGPGGVLRARVAVPLAILLLSGCRAKVRDPSVGTLELVFAPRPDPGAKARRAVLEETRLRLARRLEGLRAPTR